MQKTSFAPKHLFPATVLAVWWFFVMSLKAFAYTPLESLPGLPAGDVGLGTYLAVIFKVGVGIAGVLAVLMIVIGGIQYVGSGMSPSGKEDAKGRITNALLGLLLALTSWIILNTINPDLLKISVPSPVPSTQGTSSAPGGTTDANTRTLLSQNGITVNKTEAQGTSLAGMNQTTINEVLGLKTAVGCGSCIVVTGGTESGHATGGTYTHGNGYKVDIRPTSEVNNYITGSGNFIKVANPTFGTAQYKNAATGGVYTNEGNHWDVSVTSI